MRTFIASSAPACASAFLATAGFLLAQGCGGGKPELGGFASPGTPVASADDGGASGPAGCPGCTGQEGNGTLGTIPSASASSPLPSSDAGSLTSVAFCSAGLTTTVSGTVYDPAGKNPLYDVAVYVPKSKPSALASGASCDSCSALYTGEPVAAALTDTAGRFTMQNVPDGSNIPLVIQIGKWRRQMTIPSVLPCKDNPLPDKSLTLPKNRGEGDLPNIAISTGGADQLECLLRRVGVDATEYVPGAPGPGRIHIFRGADNFHGAHKKGSPDTMPPSPTSPMGLWATNADIMQFDIVLLSCEGAETVGMNQQVLFDYAAAGGRVFASHFHYSWFNTGPFGTANLATWTPGVNAIGDITADVLTTLPNGQPFPKGTAMKQWLGNVGALTAGLLPIVQAKHNSDVSVANTPSTPWIVPVPSDVPGETQYFSFDTPLQAPSDHKCGRVVFSDLHVTGAGNDYPTGSPITPGGCELADLSPQEKALEFMLFDLSACLTPVSLPPMAPVVIRPPK
jgi:hypothetical protein